MYHLTNDGPKECKAAEGNCPITRDSGGNHYNSIEEASEEYSRAYETFSTIKRINLPKTTIKASLTPKNGGSYYGLSINENEIKEHLKSWRKELGEDTTDELESFKVKRDKGYSFHTTVLRPKDVRKLKKSNIEVEFKDFNIDLIGIGSVKSDDKEAWFIVVESEEIDEYRNKLNLGSHDLHITIGFKNGDVHDKSKGRDSLRFI